VGLTETLYNRAAVHRGGRNADHNSRPAVTAPNATTGCFDGDG